MNHVTRAAVATVALGVSLATTVFWASDANALPDYDCTSYAGVCFYGKPNTGYDGADVYTSGTSGTSALYAHDEETTSNGYGVYGISDKGIGVYGTSGGSSGYGIGVWGVTTNSSIGV